MKCNDCTESWVDESGVEEEKCVGTWMSTQAHVGIRCRNPGMSRFKSGLDLISPLVNLKLDMPGRYRL